MKGILIIYMKDNTQLKEMITANQTKDKTNRGKVD